MLEIITLVAASPILINFALRGPYPWLHVVATSACLSLFLGLASFVTAIFIFPMFFSTLRDLPNVDQGPAWKRLFIEPTGDKLADMMQNRPNDALIRYFGVLNSERVLLTNPKDIKQVLDSEAYEFGRSYLIRRMLSPILGKKSFVVSDGPEHIACRKNVEPAFFSEHVAQICPMFWQKAASLVQAISVNDIGNKSMGQNSVLDILDWLEQATFDIAFATVFGWRTRPEKPTLEELLQEYREAFSISSGAHSGKEMALETILPSHLFLGLLPLDDVRRARASLTKIRAFCRDEIKARKEKFSEASRAQPDRDLIDTALKLETLSDEEMLELCTTFLAAGYKATSVTVAWAIYYLSTRPGFQAMLRSEIRSNLPSPDKTEAPAVTSDKIQSLPLLTAVCNETLRFAPVVHLTFREARTDTLLSGSGKVIPDGTILAICPWAIHRSPAYWRGGNSLDKSSSASHTTYPDPGTFDATRWLSDKEGGARMQYSFMPFGRGPRCCIAERVARDEMAVLLAALVGRFDLAFKSSGRDNSPDSEALRVAFGVTAKPVKLMVQAQPVEGW